MSESKEVANGYTEKLEKMSSALLEHNTNVTTKLDINSIIQKLKELGGTSEDALASCTSDDLASIGVPKILARKIVDSIFKSQIKVLEEQKKVLSAKRVDSFTITQLLEHYDPTELDSPVAKRLESVSKGKPFLAFDSEGKVLVPVSSKELKSLKEGYDSREHALVNGVPVKLFSVGQHPGMAKDENPLYKDRPLRDQECDQTNRSWSGIDPNVRVLVYLANNETGEIDVNCLNDAHNIMDLLLSKPSTSLEDFVRGRFQKASLLFDELFQQNRLPTLKITASRNKSNNPFGKNRLF